MIHATTITMEKLLLTLDEVIARLPNGDDFEHYLDELYALGRIRNIPNISPANVAFLQRTLRERQPQRILEIGCANGYSTLRFWQATREWRAHIVTMDISKPTVDEARHHFTTCAADIELHWGNAMEILPTLPREPFDFIFIDAHKANTLDFFVRARKLAAPDALIVIDDVLKFKDKMQRFYDYLATHKIQYTTLPIDEDDGVMLIDLAQQ